MKKTLALILALSVMIALCGCGNKAENPSGEAPTTEAETTTSETTIADATESEELSILSENDLQGEWYDTKTANRLVINSDKTLDYLDQPGYWSLDGNTLDINSSRLRDDLSVEFQNDKVVLINSECAFMRWGDLDKSILSFGESGSDAAIVLTLTSVDFLDSLPNEIMNSFTYSAWGNRGEYELGDGMVYARITFTIQNNTKNAIDVGGSESDLSVILDYNDGFRYATYDNGAYYFKSGDAICISTLRSSIGGTIPVQPLETKEFEVYLSCASVIASNTEAPLRICFISKYDTAASFYEYTVR